MAYNSIRATVFRLMSQNRRYRYDEDGLIRDTQREHPKAIPSTVLRYRNQYLELERSRI